MQEIGYSSSSILENEQQRLEKEMLTRVKHNNNNDEQQKRKEKERERPNETEERGRKMSNHEK